jgi:hypothetical protein
MSTFSPDGRRWLVAGRVASCALLAVPMRALYVLWVPPLWAGPEASGPRERHATCCPGRAAAGREAF